MTVIIALWAVPPILLFVAYAWHKMEEVGRMIEEADRKIIKGDYRNSSVL